MYTLMMDNCVLGDYACMEHAIEEVEFLENWQLQKEQLMGGAAWVGCSIEGAEFLAVRPDGTFHHIV
jgi:hypothetical protein